MTDMISEAQVSSNPFALAASLMPVTKIEKKTWDDSVGTGVWIPSLRMVADNSKLSKAPANLIPGTFYFCKTSNGLGAQSLGKSVIIVPVASRLKAMEQVQVPKVGAKWVSHFDPTSSEYLSVVARAAAKETDVFHGPEYLVWVDGATEIGGAWATFHCASATSRKAATDIESMVGRGQTLRLNNYPTSNAKFTWQAFTVDIANAALQLMPEVDDINARCAKFEAEKNLGKVVEAEGDGRVQ